MRVGCPDIVNRDHRVWLLEGLDGGVCNGRPCDINCGTGVPQVIVRLAAMENDLSATIETRHKTAFTNRIHASKWSGCLRDRPSRKAFSATVSQLTVRKAGTREQQRTRDT